LIRDVQRLAAEDATEAKTVAATGACDMISLIDA